MIVIIAQWTKAVRVLDPGGGTRPVPVELGLQSGAYVAVRRPGSRRHRRGGRRTMTAATPVLATERLTVLRAQRLGSTLFA